MSERHCRMHGGTSLGAPISSGNARKHSRYTVDAISRLAVAGTGFHSAMK